MTDIQTQAHADIDRLMRIGTKDSRDEAFRIYARTWKLCDPFCSDCCGDWRVLCCKPKDDEEDDKESVRLVCELCDKEQGHEPDYYSCPCSKNCSHDFCFECAQKIEAREDGICPFCLHNGDKVLTEKDKEWLHTMKFYKEATDCASCNVCVPDNKQTAEELELIYGAIQDWYKSIESKKDKQWVDDNWKSLMNHCVDKLEEMMRYRND